MNYFPYTANDLIKQMAYKGYTLYEGIAAPYDLNIIGVRTKNNDSNSFNDWLAVLYNDRDSWILHAYPCTTDPGLYYRLNPMSKLGTAVVVPGQYPGLWEIGQHKGLYRALTQVRPILVYRDMNCDEHLDLHVLNIAEGVFGINLHKAGEASTQVDKWSAGCQVIAREDHFDSLMSLCDKQLKYHPTYTSFTYTLLEEW